MSEIQSKTICLVAIVKNEEKALPRMLESVKDLVDTYVIVDTGSTDGTKKVISDWSKANDIQGKVYNRKWKNFGHNRTQAVQLAQGKADYLILLDADMVVNVGDSFKASELKADQYHVRYTGGLDYSQLLFVSGKLKWEYVGVTHEYIKCAEAKTEEHMGDRLTITHLHDGANRSDKFQRDIDLLTEALKKEPNNTRYMFYLANSYKDNGEYEKALEWYKKRSLAGGFQEEVYYSLYQSGRMFQKLKKRPNAKLSFLTAYDYRPTRLEALYEFIKMCREDKQISLAHMALRAALQTPYPEKDLLFVHKAVWDYLLLFEFGLVSYYRGDIKAFKEVNKILLKRKDLPDYLRKQIKINREIVDKVNFTKPVEGKKTTIIKDYLKEERDKYDTISIVGNGTQHKDFSKEIDNSFVVRFNAFRPYMTEKVGTKTDVNASCMIPAINKKYQNKKLPILGMLPFSQEAIAPYSSAHSMHLHWMRSKEILKNKGFKVTSYDINDEFIDVYFKVANELKAFPTVGLLGIAMAKYWGFKRIVVAGFTFYQTPDSFEVTEKKKNAESILRDKSKTHHDVIAELNLFKKWVKEDTDIEYILDDILLEIIKE